MDRLIKNRSLELANKIYDTRKSAALEFLKYEKHFLKRNCPICYNDKGRTTIIFRYQCKECIIAHVLNPKKVLTNVYKAIKKNGYFIITSKRFFHQFLGQGTCRL